MRIAVTGRSGQIALSMRERAQGKAITVVLVGRPELDLNLPQTVLPALRAANPDVIVHAAAYTAVDSAETERQEANAINSFGTSEVARAAAELAVPLIYFSTDYVFDGRSQRPYNEEDSVNPINAYGYSKLLGERAVAATGPNHAILRTSWVYSPFSHNFVKTMLSLALTREQVSVVADQHGSPTSALDIADGALAVCRKLLELPQKRELRGTFHMAAAGYASWAEFAEEIFSISMAAGGPTARVNPVPASEYRAKAERPASSRLNCAKLMAVYEIVLPAWQTSTANCVTRLINTPQRAD